MLEKVVECKNYTRTKNHALSIDNETLSYIQNTETNVGFTSATQKASFSNANPMEEIRYLV